MSETTVLNMPDATCRVCSSESCLVMDMKANFIKKNLEKYYGTKLPDNLGIYDYQILECKKCSLVWASPCEPGSDMFYQWITGMPGYYPINRWEWGAVIDRIKFSQSATDIDILEIGCGSGRFLEYARSISSGKVVGLDTTMTSVDTCLSKGLTVYCESMETYLHSSIHKQDRFDYAVAFHCLEHVSDPKELVASMLKLLKPDGRIYLSTPYSPMSFEGVWFDPLNNPPHHLTRWNCKAYEALAQQLDLQVDFIMPKALGILHRTLYALNLAWNGPSALSSRKRVLLSALVRPIEASKEFIRQSKREKVAGKVAADVILVELSRKK